MARHGVSILQFGHGGHELFYVRRLIESQGLSKPTILFTTSDVVDSREYKVHLARLEDEGGLILSVLGARSEGTWRLLRNLASAPDFKATGLIAIPNCDRILAPMIAFALRRRELPAMKFLIMRTPSRNPLPSRDHLIGRSKSALVWLLSKTWRNATGYFLTDGFGCVGTRPGFRSLLPLPDPAVTLPHVSRMTARQRLGLSEDIRIVGLLGGISRRKRPDLVLEALAVMPGVSLLVAGVSDGWFEQLVRESYPEMGDRIVRLDGYLTDEDLGLAASACDVILLTQDTDAPSGTLILSVEAGAPVVAAASPWVNQVVAQLGIGLTAQPIAASVRDALDGVLRSSPTYTAPINAARQLVTPDGLNPLVRP